MDINHIYKELDSELSTLNTKLANEAQCQYPLVKDVVTHIIHKGKRVRPILLIILAKAFEVKDMESIINSSFAIELIHTASLLHDDVVDETKKRRGKKTANIIWGNKEVILVGDHLFTQSFLAVTQMQNHVATQIIAEASSRLTIGEISQLENERNVSITIEKYLDVIYHKTASLFEAAAKLGAVFSLNGNIDSCGNFGKNIGFAFQMMDDILDYTGSKKLNKDSGTDFKERKITLPVLLLLQKTFPEKKAVIEYFSGKEKSSAVKSILAFKECVRIMKENNIFEESKVFMQNYVQHSVQFAREIQDAKLRDMLIDLLQFFTVRKV